MDIREVVFLDERHIEFNSNGRRIRRIVTPKEAEILKRLIRDQDWFKVDALCYSIV